MSLGQTTCVALHGLDGAIVTVEVDIADGLPMYSLLGLPDAALNESRDRVRAALINSNEIWPNKKVTVSLSPAWLPKCRHWPLNLKNTRFLRHVKGQFWFYIIDHQSYE